MLGALWKRLGSLDWRPYAIFVLTVIPYSVLLREFSCFSAELLHLLEYGLVGWLLVRVLRYDLDPIPAYLAALLLTAIVGLVDEIIQWKLPNRYFDLKDVQLNVIAGMLGLVLPRLVWGSAVPRSADEGSGA